jgi:hypothetical protein
MAEAELSQLHNLLRTHQSRLRVLELQAAQFGINVPPQVVTEIDHIKAEIARISSELKIATPVITRAMLRQLRQQALKAYYAQEWTQAEELLIQILATNPDDTDLQAKLTEAQRQLDLQELYLSICELRDVGLWSAVLKALNDLQQREPDYPDPERLRVWAEAQRHHERQQGIENTNDQLSQAYSTEQEHDDAESSLRASQAQMKQGSSASSEETRALPETSTGVEIFCKSRFWSVFTSVKCIIMVGGKETSYPLKPNSWTFIPIQPDEQLKIAVGVDGFFGLEEAAVVDCILQADEVQKYDYCPPLLNPGDATLTRQA